jgi:hypothetical protein
MANLCSIGLGLFFSWLLRCGWLGFRLLGVSLTSTGNNAPNADKKLPIGNYTLPFSFFPSLARPACFAPSILFPSFWPFFAVLPLFSLPFPVPSVFRFLHSQRLAYPFPRLLNVLRVPQAQTAPKKPTKPQKISQEAHI